MTVPYATPGDVYRRALSAQAFAVVPHRLDAAKGDVLDFATGTFYLAAHGLLEDDVVSFVLVAPSGGALPGGASRTKTYTPTPLDFRRFTLTESGGSSTATFTDAGAILPGGVASWGLLVDPEARLRACILAESADCDQQLIAHSTPIERDLVTLKYPEKLVDTVCWGAALRAITGLFFEAAAAKIPTERLQQLAKDNREQKAEWARGVPLYPKPLDQTDGQADNSGRSSGRTALPWGRRCGVVL
jgi:hypothetical protein